MAKSTCGACGEVFKSVAGFDKHRTGNFEEPIYGPRVKGNSLKIVGYTPHSRRCMTVEEMRDSGMLKNDKGLWITSAYEQSAHAGTDKEEETTDGSIA